MSLNCAPPSRQRVPWPRCCAPTPESILEEALCFVPVESRTEARLQLLEAVAAKFGRFELDWYHDATNASKEVLIVDVRYWTPRLMEVLREGAIHPALTLCRLAEPELPLTDRRRAGSYYTDFRLATHLGSRLRIKTAAGRVPLMLDPASGSGVLLVATVLALSGGESAKCDFLIRRSVHAADFSAIALRGAALALASLARGSRSVAAMLKRVRCGDSLSNGVGWWRDLAPKGFDLVVGNPPWEKLKISRHEHLRSSGMERHYGSDYHGPQGLDSWQKARQSSADYNEALSGDYNLQGCGDADLYKLFLELMLKLLRPGGELSAYVPAGLIRSLGCRHLRQLLLERADELECCVFENRAHFFPIDTRFKFLGLRMKAGYDGTSCQSGSLLLSHATGTDDGVKENTAISIDRSVLREIRPDLSLPEVRSVEEWKIFRTITAHGVRIGDLRGGWRPDLLREVDMTIHRETFLDFPAPGALPLIEGRMVHQFNHAAKHYGNGRGRRAIWHPARYGQPRQLKPQFWYPETALAAATRRRALTPRIGFCDISGQTNERTMLAAQIPAGTICGNKVPTILFPEALDAVEHRKAGDLWLAVLNSFVFDWMLRRVVTTTVNYFLLLDLPFPKKIVEQTAASPHRLGEISRQLSAQDGESLAKPVPQGWEAAELRAEADWRVLNAYDQPVRTLEIMLKDFPLLDRSQPPLAGEERSTITRDFVLLRAAQALGGVSADRVAAWEGRVLTAHTLGAMPYVPSHLDVGDLAAKD